MYVSRLAKRFRRYGSGAIGFVSALRRWVDTTASDDAHVDHFLCRPNDQFASCVFATMLNQLFDMFDMEFWSIPCNSDGKSSRSAAG